MAAIAGIACANQKELVEHMLTKMSHRGKDWMEVIHGSNGNTLGMIGFKTQEQTRHTLKKDGLAVDGSGPGRFSIAKMTKQGFSLRRDPLGVAPLYYGWTKDGDFCFASEVKGLMEATLDIHEMKPGTIFDGKTSTPYFKLAPSEAQTGKPELIASELRSRLKKSVESCIGDGNVGSWLSGGLDSSLMAALARPHVDKLHTFAAGLADAPDIVHARIMADHIHSIHHEVIVNQEKILAVLPEVIYALETFDALLIRSSILNYLAAREVSQYVPAVFSGEGGDELFAGYEYLKKMDPSLLPSELIDITGRLHNTALQRVDRCASANQTVPYVCFLDPKVVEFAISIPVEYKIKDGVEKWILRQAVADLLPDPILNRPKAKFWEGSGIQNMLSLYVEDQITTKDFNQERKLPNGLQINTKEELYYYRIFKEHFGTVSNLNWMGRTKGAPVA